MNGTIIFPSINTAKILHIQENFRVHAFDQYLKFSRVRVNTKHFITTITDGISANIFICSIMSIAATYVPDNYDLLSFHRYHNHQSVSYYKF